jgi:hypothetical protein
MKVEAEDLWPLILDFVETYFGEDDLKEFKKYFELKIKHKKDPLVQAGGLSAMLACFLKNNKDAYKAFKKHHQAKHDESQQAHAEDEKPSKKRKRSEAESEEPTKKRKRVSSVASAEGPVTRRKSHDAAETQNGPAPVFKRIDATKFTNIANHFADNTFEAKEKFGQGGDSYGSWSNSKLADKHGKGFLKEKNKMKNR